MFLRNDHELQLAGGSAVAAGAHRAFGRDLVPLADQSAFDRLRVGAARIDWVPDLGANIGSGGWWRGLATLVLLCGGAYSLAPDFSPLPGNVPAPLSASDRQDAAAQAIAPLALGSTTGRQMASSDLVVPLAEAPERPEIELAATLGDGDDFASALQRAGVGRRDAAGAADLISQEVALGAIPSGTRIALTLGRRADKAMARPLEKLSLRARFDLAVTINRAGTALAMTRQPIAIDDTPLRIQGLVGSSLYRSARAAGAPAKVVEAYIKALATRLSIGSDVHAADSFDLIIERERAATGETRTGALLFAGIDQGAKRLQLVRWNGEGRDDWYDANGQAKRRGFMGMPVAGRISSGFGLRVHPILGFMRMHKGLDIAAPNGTPIFAAINGIVSFTGRAGGYGNFVKVAHNGGIVTGYGHMSRIAVRPGQRVHQGQVIGYVGSTGISTGPHLHWEVWRNGTAINPRSISYDNIATLSGEKLRDFKRRVAGLLAISPGS